MDDTPGFTDADIVDWLIDEVNKRATAFDAANSKLRHDMHFGFYFLGCKPGFRVTREELHQKMHEKFINPVTKKLKS